MTRNLTRRQEIFVAEYVVHLNATRAAVSAGYSKKTANEQGSRLLANVKVAEEIAKKTQKRMDKLDISAEKILNKLAEIAFFDVRKLFNEDGSPKDLLALDDQTAAAIAGLDVCELFDGSQGDQKHVIGLVKKIRLADRIRALELLGKHQKLFSDRVEHKGKLTLEDLVVGSRNGGQARNK